MAGMGLRVFAGVKTPEEGELLLKSAPAASNSPPSGGIVPVVMDLSRKDEIERALQVVSKALERDHLRLLALVNNGAPSPEVAPLETLALDKLRYQLEVNVVGQLAVIQAVLPLLRQAGTTAMQPGVLSPRLIFVGCAPSQVPVPLLGSYHTSKQCSEALASTLRLELRPWKIDVSTVNLGTADTSFLHAGMTTMRENLGTAPAQLKDPAVWKPYMNMGAHLDAEARTTIKRKNKLSPDACADAIVNALLTRRPEASYSVGTDSLFTIPLLMSLPAKLRDVVDL